MLLTNRQREEISKHSEPISPFSSLSCIDGIICGTKQIGNKLYTIKIQYFNSDEAIKLLSQLSYLGDETFKLYCELKAKEI